MIIVKLTGGLGNQMFQYAAGRATALCHHARLALDIRTLERKNWADRRYSLDCYNIQANIIRPNWLTILFLHQLKRPLFDKDIVKISDNTYMDGTWQNEGYFRDFRPQLLKDFTLKKPLSKKAVNFQRQIKQTNSVSLHIRRTDYLSEKMSKIYTICGLDYYNAARITLEKKLSNPTYYIFTDDTRWAHRNLGFLRKKVFVSGDGIKDFEEIFLMSNCQHNIIANSSFSWWGAWLNKNKDKIVISPKKWFIDPVHEPEGLTMKGWTKI